MCVCVCVRVCVCVCVCVFGCILGNMTVRRMKPSSGIIEPVIWLFCLCPPFTRLLLNSSPRRCEVAAENDLSLSRQSKHLFSERTSQTTCSLLFFFFCFNCRLNKNFILFIFFPEEVMQSSDAHAAYLFCGEECFLSDTKYLVTKL